MKKVCAHLSEKNVLLDEQKRCRKDSQETKDQLLIDKQILKHCKKHQRNLAMRWIDYKKTYDMVPHVWMIEVMVHCVKSVQIRSFFWSVFSRIRTEYGDIVSLRIQSECKKIRTIQRCDY